MASKFQEMGGILDFVPWNLNSFPCNFFFVRWNFYFLGRFLHSKPWFLYESAQFSSERREIPKKTRCFPAKTSGSCEIQKRWESIISDQLFWICKRRVKLGGQNGESFLSTESLHLILFSTSVSIHWTLQANEHFKPSHILMVLSEKVCKFSGNALATYFNTLPSTSISMPCISPFDEKKEMLQKWVLQHLQRSLCRKEAIRTPDPYVPNVVRYQLRYFPISWSPKETPRELCSFWWCKDKHSCQHTKGMRYFFVVTFTKIFGWRGSLVINRTFRLPRKRSTAVETTIFISVVSPGRNVVLGSETERPGL